MNKLVRVVAATALAAGSLVGGQASASVDARQTFRGVIDGAEFKVEMPERWNGTLLVYSHGYYPLGFELPVGHANKEPETPAWLLEYGFALAASNYKGVSGFQAERAVRDQMAVLDWFEEHVGQPRRTIATGSSMGAAVSVMMAERYPDRFDGVQAMCGPLDLYAQWNMMLDVNFALKTLLDVDADLIHGDSTDVQALQAAVAEAMKTPLGRARIALASAFGNIEGWNSAHDPKPSTIAGQIEALAVINQFGTVGTFGPSAVAELGSRAGGNPLWNVGVDYRRQLIRSSQRDFVRQVYRSEGLDLDGDLARLAVAPRIAPEPAAVRWMHRYAVPRGTNPDPVITLHNTVDAAVADHERWYAGQVRRHGHPSGLRQLFVGRATHCAFSAAEEIVTLRALLHRIDTGGWPSLNPSRLNAAANGFADVYREVFNYPVGDAVRPPAFTRFTPDRLLRPSR